MIKINQLKMSESYCKYTVNPFIFDCVKFLVLALLVLDPCKKQVIHKDWTLASIDYKTRTAFATKLWLNVPMQSKTLPPVVLVIN